MDSRGIDVLDLMHNNQPVDWEAIRIRATLTGVGSWRWEEAWLKALAGHAAGTAAFRQALARGADELSAAAVAGMVAAHHARAVLTEEQFRVLVEPLSLDPPPQGGRVVEYAA